MSFIIIGISGILLFWLFYNFSNTSYHAAKKQVINQLKDPQCSDQDKQIAEKQLSNLIQNKPKTSLTIVIAFAVILIPLCSYFYYSIGTPNATELLTQEGSQKKSQAPQMSMEEAISKLEERLQENPEDVDAQMLYARSQVTLNNYAKAVEAYRKADELVPNQSVILTELAEAIAFYNDNRSFQGEPEELIARAVQLEPNNQKALWLHGMIYYEKGDLNKTNEIWTNLYDLMQDESTKSQLLEQLNDVRNKLGMSIETKADSSTQSISSLVLANIQIDKELLSKLDNKPAVLYVYTKATTGMPMPIAVFRKSLEQVNKSFPISIELTDNNSLQSSRKLSDFKEVKIGARISFSGNATPQPGDFESLEKIINIPSSETIEISINTIKQ